MTNEDFSDDAMIDPPRSMTNPIEYLRSQRQEFGDRRRVGIEMALQAQAETESVRSSGSSEAGETPRETSPPSREAHAGMRREDMERVMFPHHSRHPDEAERRIAGHFESNNRLGETVIQAFEGLAQTAIEHDRRILDMIHRLERGRY